MTWVCKGSQFALSHYPSKMISAVLDVWLRRPYMVLKTDKFFTFNQHTRSQTSLDMTAVYRNTHSYRQTDRQTLKQTVDSARDNEKL